MVGQKIHQSISQIYNTNVRWQALISNFGCGYEEITGQRLREHSFHSQICKLKLLIPEIGLGTEHFSPIKQRNSIS